MSEFARLSLTRSRSAHIPGLTLCQLLIFADFSPSFSRLNKPAMMVLFAGGLQEGEGGMRALLSSVSLFVFFPSQLTQKHLLRTTH